MTLAFRRIPVKVRTPTMKGFAHFMSGLAAASCFPPAVTAAQDGNPLYFLLGGIAALLPDTLDFKFFRYFYRHDAEVVPDPLAPDPQLIADAVAAAIDAAARNRRPFRLRLHTIRLGSDRWQRYRLRFDPATRRVTATLTDITDTGGNPEPGTAVQPTSASATFSPPLRLEYTAETDVDIFDGPHFEMNPGPDGSVTPAFIPWHRQSSHSVGTGLLLALPAGVLLGPLAGAVTFCAHTTHVLMDQLGYMGSNLLWPFTQRRTPGLKLHHSAGAAPNLAAVWLSALLIYANLAIHATPPLAPPANPLRLLLLVGVLPLAMLAFVRRLIRKR